MQYTVQHGNDKYDAKFTYYGFTRFHPKNGPYIAVVQCEDIEEIWSIQNKKGIKELRRFYKEEHGMNKISIHLFRNID